MYILYVYTENGAINLGHFLVVTMFVLEWVRKFHIPKIIVRKSDETRLTLALTTSMSIL